MTTHTPGPWKVISKAGYSGHCVADNYTRSVAAFPSNSKRDEAERNANARLIAAAPELLEVLKFAEEYLRHDALTAREAVRAAIAKAEGTRRDLA